MAKSRFAWGVDIGNRALKAVKLVRTGDGVRIDDLDIIEHENILSNAGDNREQIIHTALALFNQKHNIKGGTVAIGVSGQQSFARFIKLPPVEDRKIPEIVRFEAIQQIPFPLDEVEWSYQLFRNEGSPDVEVGIFAMRKDLVQQHIRYFTDIGMNVQVVQMNPLALYNGLYHDKRLEGTTMVIDLGAENADLIIAEGEQIWMRSVPIGGNHFTEALVKQFKLRFEKAEEMKRTAATSKYGRQILQAMRPVFADLVSEIQRSIGFYSSVHRDSRINKVLALGGTFRLPGLQKYLQQNLSLDVVKVDQLGDAPPTDAKLATALSENILSTVGAYGLALQAMDEAKITSSLLPGEIKREKEWRRKTPVFIAAAAAVVAGAVVIPYSRYRTEQYKFDQNREVRTAIDTTAKDGKRQAGEWEAVAAGGAADRKAIADVMSLTKFRDLWPKLYADIKSCVPPLPAPVRLAAGAKPATTPVANPNDQRVILEDLQAEYRPDVASLLALDEAAFNNSLPLTHSQGGAIPGRRDSTTGGATVGLPTGGAVVGRDVVAPTIPAAGTPAAPAGDATAAAAAPARGYLVTVHVIAPNPEEGVPLVNRTFVANVRKRIQEADAAAKRPAAVAAAGKPAPPASPPPTYQIKRVSVPHSVQFALDAERVRQLQERQRFLKERETAGSLEALFTPPVVGQPAGAMAPPIAAPVTVPPGGTGLPGDAQAEDTTYFIDPVTKEDVRKWWDVTVRMVVVVDPAPQAAGAAAPTE